MTGLNKKQTRFAEEYLIDLNATQAAIRAGYSKRTAGQQAHELLKKPQIADFVATMIEERSKAAKITREWVLDQAVKVHNRCMGEVEPIMIGHGDDRTQATDDDGNLLFKFDSSGANKALEIAGKHVDVDAFKERVELSTSADAEAIMEAAMKRARDARGEASDDA